MSCMGRPRKDISQDTVEQLLEGAEKVFARDGFAAARLEDMAAHAGISRPSLLYHFSSKEVLYAAVVERIFHQLGSALSQAMEQGEAFEERLRSVICAFSMFMATRPQAASLLVREIVASQGPGRARLLELGGPLIDRIEGWINWSGQARPGVPIRAVIMHVVSDVLLRHASGELSELLWRSQEEPASWPLVEALLVRKEER
jgi:AcrR family transcriptional regulator